jgi:hypothetical protein
MNHSYQFPSHAARHAELPETSSGQVVSASELDPETSSG